MTRASLASAALLLAITAGSTGCGGYYYRDYYRPRVVYAVPAPPPAIIVRAETGEAPPPPAPPPRPRPRPAPPPAAPAPRTIIVHAPPGSMVIVNPQGTPTVVRQRPAAPPPEEPVDAERPADPPPPPARPMPQQDPGWNDEGG